MPFNINPTEFRLWAQYIYQISGIHLEFDKAYLIETRLKSLVGDLNCTSFNDLFLKARADKSQMIEKKIIDRITTKETRFFRDHAPFEMLKFKILPDLIDRKTAGSKTAQLPCIRIWSAGCSTGQETYSIAICIHEMLGRRSDCASYVLGTDLSVDAVAQASNGVYSPFEIARGMSALKRDRYFSQVNEHWEINADIRCLVTFKVFNLMSSYLGLGKFDVIFCRNVAIYFNFADRQTLFRKFAQALSPGGYLIVGASENVTGAWPEFQSQRSMRSVYYQLQAKAGKA